MKEIKFTKLVASGNDFVLVDSRKNKVAKWSSGQVVKWPDFAKKVCRQKLGVSADGMVSSILAVVMKTTSERSNGTSR